MIEAQVAQVNRDLAAEERVSGSQIRRFLILHKMLDADDGEALIDGLYSDAGNAAIETEITFEDGRKGAVKADLEIRDAETAPVTGKLSQAAE